MSAPPPLTTEALKAWATYGKERFDALDTQLRDFRAWARQLITAIGLIVGLELTLVAKIVFDVKPTVPLLWWVCLASLLGTTGFQTRILVHVLDVGYVGKTLPSPGKPADFWPEITNGEDAIVKEIGIHYATAYNTLRGLSNDVAKQLAAQTRFFAYSLAAFCTAVALCAFLAFTTARHPTPPPPPTGTADPPQQLPATTNRRQTMSTDNNTQLPTPPADQTTSPQPTNTPAAPAAPAQQTTSPVSAMPAPTVPMDTEHFAARSPRPSELPQSHIGQDTLVKVEKITPASPPKKKD
jgi:hypothetical protein